MDPAVALVLGLLIAHAGFVAHVLKQGHRRWFLALFAVPLVGQAAYLLYDLPKWRGRIPAVGETVMARLHLMHRCSRIIRPGEKLKVIEVTPDGTFSARAQGGVVVRLHPHEVVAAAENTRLAS